MNQCRVTVTILNFNMRKDILFFAAALLLLVVVLLFFNSAYRQLGNYSEQINRQNAVHSAYQQLSREINDAAVIDRSLQHADLDVHDVFFTDSNTVIEALDTLKAAVRDTVNVRVANTLDSVVKAELGWILTSYVPDSIVRGKGPEHVASFRYINLLINQGIERTIYLVRYLETQLERELDTLRIWMILFIIVSGTLLIYTVRNVFRQRHKIKTQERELFSSERIYRTIASSIPGSVITLMDTDRRYFLVEGDMVEKLGYRKKDLLGKKMEEVLSPERLAAVGNDYQRAFEGHVVIREVHRNGFDIISRFIPLKDEDHQVYAVMAVAIDVSELKAAQKGIIELNRDLEEKVKKRTEELARSNMELEAFSYSVSHDLRAPLRAIIGFVTILEEDYASKLDDEAKRLIEVVRNNTVKMRNLIDDLLTFFRVGRQEVTKTPVDSNEMVREVVKDLLHDHADSPIEWDIRSLPPVMGDVNSLRQVWINLIANAMKYSSKKARPRIEIGSSKESNEVIFYVKDNGVGFDQKYSNKLFKVFQRLHAASEFEGTGIGLALVEKIVSKHGGRVWGEGKLDEGAEFYFSLPG